MKSIVNLIIYIGMIFLIIFLLNKLYKSDNLDNENFTNTISRSEKDKNNDNMNLSETYEHIQFDYNDNNTKENINEQYNKELDFGVTLQPNYGNNNMMKGSDINSDKDLFDYNGNVDQRTIYGDKLYTHPIHTERGDNTYINKPIKDLYDDSITDFKKISHKKQGNEGDFVVSGNFNLGSFAPDFINYDNEKPENGGVLAGNDFFAFDPLASGSNAIF
jgi:hypothetical protein